MNTLTRFFTLSLLALLATAQPGMAQFTTFTNGAGNNDWQDAGNWNNGIPTAATDPFIGSGFTVNLNTGTATANIVNVRQNAQLNVSGGVTLNAGRLDAGLGEDGTVVFSGAGTNATFSNSGFSDIVVGSVGATGTVTVEDGALLSSGTGSFTGITGLGSSGGHGILNLNGTAGSRGTLASRGILTASTGALNFDGGVLRALGPSTGFIENNANLTVTINGGGAFIGTNGFNLTIAKAMGGTGGLTKLGSGSLILSGTNTYMGGTTIEAGAMAVSSDANLGDASGGLTIGDARLRFFSGFTTNRATSLTSANATIEIDSGQTLTHNGTISGTGTLNKIGTGTLALTNGGNTYTGGTTIDGGTLVIGTTGATGSGTITVLGSTIQYADGVNETNPIVLQNDVTLEVLSGSAEQSGAIGETGGSFSVTKTGTGTLELTSTNTYTGGTFINEGTLGVIGNALGNGDITFNGGTLQSLGLIIVNNDAVLNMDGGTIEILFNTQIIYDGDISGVGSLTKTGVGQLFLEGAGTWSGGTIVEDGDLFMDAANALPQNTDFTINGGRLIQNFDLAMSSLSGTGGEILVQNSETLTVNQSTDTTFSGSLDNRGAISKIGTGELALTGQISDNGTVTVSGGRLVLSNSSNSYTGGTTLDPGGTLVIANDNVLGAGDLTINGGTIEGTGDHRVTSVMVVNGDFSVAPFNTTPTIDALQLDGDMVLGDTTRTITNTLDFFSFEFGEVRFGGVISGDPGVGLTLQDNGALPGFNVVFFAFDGAGSNTYDGLTTLNSNVSLQLAKTGGATAIAGDLTVNAESVAAVVNDEQIADTATITLNGTGQLQVGTGGAVTETFDTLMDDGSGNAVIDLQSDGSTVVINQGTYHGTITGGAASIVSLAKEGPGTLTLRGASDFLGNTTLNGGTLRLENDLALSGGTLSVLGSTVSYGDGQNIANPMILMADVDLEVLGTDSATQSGAISEDATPRSVTKIGDGTLALTATNTYSGGTVLNAGTLAVSADGNLGDAAGGLIFNGGTLRATMDFTTNRATTLNASGGTLESDNGVFLTHGGVISGDGGLAKAGAGFLVLTGNNSYLGDTVVNGGVLTVGDGGTSGSLGVGDATVNGMNTLQYNRSDNITETRNYDGDGLVRNIGSGQLSLDGVISGGLQVSAQNSGRLVLNNAGNSYTGGTALSDAELLIGATGATGNSNIFVFGASTISYGDGVTEGNIIQTISDLTLNVAGADSATQAGAISQIVPAPNLTKTGTGLLTLTGNNNYSGTTTIQDGGTLRVGNGGTSGNLGAGNVMLEDNSMLAFSRSDMITVDQQISGMGSVTQNGTGTAVLNGDNSHTGGTTLLLGTLRLGSSTAAGNGGITAFGGNTLSYADGIDVANNASLLDDVSFEVLAGESATHSGTISDFGLSSGIVTKTGGGTLMLNNANTHTGGTNVTGGTLMTTNPDAIGTGDLNVNTAGTFVPMGPVNVGGNFALNAGGILSINVDDGGIVNVAGNADIADGNLVAAGAVERGDEFVLIDSSGLSGDLAAFLIPAGAVLEQTATQLLLVGGSDPEAIQAAANTPNEVSVAGMLSPLFTSPDVSPDLEEVLSALEDAAAAGNDGTVRLGLNQLAPEELAVIKRMAFAYANTGFRNLQRRGFELRSGARGASLDGLTFFGRDGRLRPTSAPAIAGTEDVSLLGLDPKMMAAKPDNRWGFFANGTGQFGDVDGSTDLPGGYDFTTAGVTMGLDYRLARNVVLGLALGYAGSDADTDTLGSSVEADAARFGLYASVFDPAYELKGEGWYLDAYAGGAYNSYDTTRVFNIGGVNRTAEGSPDGLEFDGSLIGGYDIKLGGGWILSPYTGVQYTHVGIDSYTETGGGAINLNVDETSAESLRSNLGVVLSWSGEAGGITWRPEVRAAWQHEFLDGIETVNSRFASGAATLFATRLGDDIADDSAFVGAGINADFTNTVSAFLSYDAEANPDYLVHSINGGFTIQF